MEETIQPKQSDAAGHGPAGTGFAHLRIARPVTDLARTSTLYCHGLGFNILGQFENHDGFDGIMLGRVGDAFHLELTTCRAHKVKPSPTPDDLIVLYLPDENDWQNACERMLTAGFLAVRSLNPYWDARGRTFEDPDGYRFVLQNTGWTNSLIR